MARQTLGSWHGIAAARQRLVLCRLMIDIMRDLHGTYAPASEPFGGRLETFFIGMCIARGQFEESAGGLVGLRLTGVRYVDYAGDDPRPGFDLRPEFDSMDYGLEWCMRNTAPRE